MRVGWQPRIPIFVTDLDMLSRSIPNLLRDMDFTYRRIEPRPIMWIVWDTEE